MDDDIYYHYSAGKKLVLSKAILRNCDVTNSISITGQGGSNILDINAPDGSNLITIDENGGLKIHTLTQGRVVIVGTDGLLTTSANLTFSSNTLTVNGSIVEASDKRLKKNIKKTDLGLQFINKLNPVSFKWKDKTRTKIEHGFIAQEVIETLKTCHINPSEYGLVSGAEHPHYSLRYTGFIAPLVKATQELNNNDQQQLLYIKKQKETIEKQELRIKDLEHQFNILNREFNLLKNKI